MAGGQERNPSRNQRAIQPRSVSGAFAPRKGVRPFVKTRIANLCIMLYIPGMATKTMNISLPGELKAFIDARVRSGFYGNASDVIRAGLRALTREEMSASYREFQEIMATLPKDPLTPDIEQEIVKAVRKSRA